METVYKYPLAWKVCQGIWLPLKRVLTVEIQNGVPCLWAVVDTNEPAVKLRVMMTSTGTDDKEVLDEGAAGERLRAAHRNGNTGTAGRQYGGHAMSKITACVPRIIVIK